MSATRLTYIHCDATPDRQSPDCHELWSADVAQWDTATAQRREAHEAGWVTRGGGRDYCPSCRDNF